MAIDLDDPRLTAYALGELDDAAEVAAVESLLAAHPEARRVVEEVRSTGDLLRRELAAEGEHAAPVRDLAIRRAVEDALQPRRRRLPWGMLSLAASALILGGTAFLLLPGGRARREVATGAAGPVTSAPASREAGRATAPAAEGDILASNAPRPATPDILLRSPVAMAFREAELREAELYAKQEGAGVAPADPAPAEVARLEMAPAAAPLPPPAGAAAPAAPSAGKLILPATAAPKPGAVATYYGVASGGAPGMAGGSVNDNYAYARPAATEDFAAAGRAIAPAGPPAGSAPAPTPMSAPAAPVAVAVAPASEPVPAGRPQPRGLAVGGQPGHQGQPPALRGLNESLAAAAPAAADPAADVVALSDGTSGRLAEPEARLKRKVTAPGTVPSRAAGLDQALSFGAQPGQQAPPPPPVAATSREAFAPLVENPFVRTLDQPQSTFALDVDTASYAIVRRYLMAQNSLPPRDAVRVEELVNAFRYDDPAPTGEAPLAVGVEIARSPWNAEHRLARISVTGRTVAPKDRPRANLVFLIDVSGSMDAPDKLPLLKRGMTMLTEQLGEGDRVAIVTYSDTARVALPPTRGDERRTILSALEELKPGGSTNGAGGLELAYNQAAAAFVEGGANRVILASDGDFNVGETDNDRLVGLIAEKAKSRIFLTVLGFGTGDLQDARLEKLADRGNGNYHYIDSPREAKRVLVRQVSGTLVTVAKDVKIQVDFNPSKVGAYRLIGYENRLLPAAAFRDDRKDGGELGAGHAVCALYELVPAGREGAAVASRSRFVRPAEPAQPDAPQSFVVNYRWKPPEGDVGLEREVPAIDSGRDYAEASESFRWAAAVASFGQVLRASAFRGTATLDGVLELAGAATGPDPRGERAAFLDLVRKAKELGAR